MSLNAEGPLHHLVRALAGVQGLGPRSARRAAIDLLGADRSRINGLIDALGHARDAIKPCSACGNLDDLDPCRICQDPARPEHQLCVVTSVADLWAIEKSRSYRDRYHVLGGVLSLAAGAADPVQEQIRALGQRLGARPHIREVILALPATVEGQSTAHVIVRQLTDALPATRGLVLTRLAQGVPMGGDLAYLDQGTIAAALTARARMADGR